jgi:hypothetical protein
MHFTTEAGIRAKLEASGYHLYSVRQSYPYNQTRVSLPPIHHNRKASSNRPPDRPRYSPSLLHPHQAHQQSNHLVSAPSSLLGLHRRPLTNNTLLANANFTTKDAV